MYTYHLVVHVYEHKDGPWTYAARVTSAWTPQGIRYPLYAFTGVLPGEVSGDPRTALRAVLRRLTPQ